MCVSYAYELMLYICDVVFGLCMWVHTHTQNFVTIISHTHTHIKLTIAYFSFWLRLSVCDPHTWISQSTDPLLMGGAMLAGRHQYVS